MYAQRLKRRVLSRGLRSMFARLCLRAVLPLYTDMEVEEDDHTLDPYLRPPAIKNSVKSNTVFVAVPALPRG